MVNNKVVQSEKGLRVQIKRNLNKEIHPATQAQYRLYPQDSDGCV